jgi:tetratricopeptide (TPR) repeat protein
MNKQQIINLMNRGYELLKEGRYEEALKCGRRLEKQRHSSGIEIAALALQRQGKPKAAIRVLRRGVRWADRVWLLWHLLGHCYSDAGDFRNAERAYHEALLRPKCSPSWIHLNRSIAFLRAGKIRKASDAVKRVRSPELYRLAEGQRIQIALRAGRNREAFKRALRLRKMTPNKQERYDAQQTSAILLDCASGLKQDSCYRTEALRLAHKAYETWTSERALAAIREIIANPAASKQAYTLLIQGVWHTTFAHYRLPPGFFRNMYVVASNEAAAFEYAKCFFPVRVRKSLRMSEVNAARRPNAELEGVYHASELMMYSRRNQR